MRSGNDSGLGLVDTLAGLSLLLAFIALAVNAHLDLIQAFGLAEKKMCSFDRFSALQISLEEPIREELGRSQGEPIHSFERRLGETLLPISCRREEPGEGNAPKLFDCYTCTLESEQIQQSRKEPELVLCINR